MGILQIANHMVCSTLRSFLFLKKLQRNLSTSNIYRYLNVLIVLKKRRICISLPFLSNKTWKYRWRIWRRGIDLPKSFMFYSQPCRALLPTEIAWSYFFFPHWTPIISHLTVKWKEGLFFLNWRTPKEEKRHKKNDHHEKEVKMILLNWLHS